MASKAKENLALVGAPSHIILGSELRMMNAGGGSKRCMQRSCNQEVYAELSCNNRGTKKGS